jgi:glucosamine-6-phosphate deaminase
MQIKTYTDRPTMGRAAARHAGRVMNEAIASRGEARIIAATGASQFDFLDALTASPDVDWQAVEMFHLDEYVGLPIDHPASFRRYLLERLIDRTSIPRFHFLDAEQDAAGAAARVGRALSSAPIDVAFVGIGENGHLAFNDPPANFETDEPYIIVTLDAACRRQQAGEGWFASVDDVPPQAVSMSIRQIMKSKEIVCVVPDARKADAVKATIEGQISPEVPASILRSHPNATLYLDRDAAARLAPASRGPILEDDQA